MVDISQENRVTARGRQVRRTLSTFDHSHVGQLFAFHVLSNDRELTFADVCGEHLSGLERFGENDRHRSKTRANVSHGHSWCETENIGEFGGFELCLPPLLRHLLGVRFLTCQDRRCPNNRGKKGESMHVSHAYITSFDCVPCKIFGDCGWPVRNWDARSSKLRQIP